ncbi:MAG TPA: hypothetical protein DCM05_03965 [Elusimicrobia bacterium]|nr:hypothetical protein [Elusimicrobiota bacterium]
MPMRKPQPALKSDNRKEKEILGRLRAGLSDEEIQCVLAGALSTLGNDGIGRLAAKLDPDTGAALRRAMQSTPKSAEPSPGPAKVLQEWNKAWKDWDRVINEACDEQGNYVIQGHHWEQPYFDPLSVTGDLEPIAARMALLLPRVFDEDLDPDCNFANAVAESVDEIRSSLPEWMGTFEYESFGLGPKATGCLIEWELRRCRREAKSLFHLLDELRELEHSNRGLDLDDKAMAAFVRNLGKDAKRDILEGIRAHKAEGRWSRVLNSAHSGWFTIYKDLCRGQDRSSYLQACRSRISQDWSLAIPVIKELSRKEENDELYQVCAEAATSYLYIRGGKNWDPRETLIASRGGGLRGKEPDERFIALLTTWRQVAAALGREDTDEAIRLQSALLSDWRNWDRALSAFSRVPSPAFDAMRDELFDQWRSLVTERSIGCCDFGQAGLWERPRPEGSWVRALIDAARQGDSAASGFQESIRFLLKAIEAGPHSPRRCLNELARLSLDVESGDWLKAYSPTLTQILGYGWAMDKALLASRRTWLHRLGATTLVPELQAFWKRNIHRFIPGPESNAGSDYDRCVEWMQALWEVDSDAAKRLLGEWGAVHWRRRNLWRAVGKKGLPVPDLHGRRS